MFMWTGALDRVGYAWRVAITIVFLIGTILLFPYLSKAIVSASHCALDTCGAVALVAAAFLRPILFLVALAMALSACVRRARDAGLRPWLGTFPTLMLLGDDGFLQYVGTGWAYPFSAGILTIKPPAYALFGAALMALLAVPSRDALRAGGIRLVDRALLILAALLSIEAALRAGILPVFVLTSLPPLLMAAVDMSESYAAYTMPVFLVLAVYRVWRSHAAALGASSPAAEVVPATPSLWQLKRAVLIGAVIAFAVVLWAQLASSQMPFPWVLFALVANVLPFFVPTFLLYTALVAAILRFMARRDAIATAAVLVALIPFGFWAGSLASVLRAKAHEREAVAAIPKVGMPAKPGAVVIEGEAWPLINCARSRILSGGYGFDDVLTRGQSKSQYLRFTKATANSPVNKGVAADSAPAEYLLIRFPRRPSFFQDRVPIDSASPPVEIYAVGSAGTQLVAASYTALNRPPAFPPMLTAFGWYWGDNSTTSEKSCESVAGFLQRELLDKLVPART
ncbi:MAG TPA: hypothetical protein VK438_00635 [Xanthobacteraceae bacterium]|nr:hypothetical protein [Xanthobacteraceae bacterium]